MDDVLSPPSTQSRPVSEIFVLFFPQKIFALFFFLRYSIINTKNAASAEVTNLGHVQNIWSHLPSRISCDDTASDIDQEDAVSK